MCPSQDYFIPPEERPEPTSTLEALQFLRVHEPELAQVLEEAARQRTVLPLSIEGYAHPRTRRVVIALLRSAHALKVSVLLEPLEVSNSSRET